MRVGRPGSLLMALALLLIAVASAQKVEGLSEPVAGRIDFHYASPGLESLPGTDVHAGNSALLRAHLALDWHENWTKRGVVVDIGAPGDPDSITLSAPTVVYADGEYKLWYQATSGPFPVCNILYANSTDGITWVKHGVVLGPGTPGQDNYPYFPFVMKQGSVYKMWYSGYSAPDLSGIYRIYYATSSDGLVWNRQGLAIDVGAPGSYDDFFVYNPFVMYDGTYRMWYDGNDHTNVRIMYATSTDGITWMKRGVSLNLGAPGSKENVHVTSAAILNESGGYHMWYRGSDGSINRIFYATSSDGISWTGRKMVIDVGPANTESVHVNDPAVLHLPGKPYQVWYTGRSSSGVDRIHYATLSPFALPAPVDVAFYLDSVAPANVIGTNTTRVGALAQALSEITWRAVPLGHHIIYAVIDPLNRIAEMNESNNTASLQINVTNRPPIVDAGPDRVVFRNEVATLDGTATVDPDGDTLAYTWVQTGGRPVGLAGADTPMATLVPRYSGMYTFNLTALDPWGGFSNDTVRVTVTNRQPVADAGLDQTPMKRSRVILDGTGSSDPDGDVLSYTWVQTGGLPVALVGAGTASPSFIPSLSGQYVFRLTVDDGDGGTAIASTRINVTNADPVANAGSNQVVRKNTLVALDGASSSDSDGDTLTFAWVQTGGPSVTLFGAGGATPRFTPTASGVYAFQLTVDDGDGGASTSTVQVTVTNAKPTARAGDDASVMKNSVVTLDGSTSLDSDLDALTFNWTQTGGPHASLGGSNTIRPSFTASRVGTYVFLLTVNDGDGGIDNDTVKIVVWGRAPIPSLLADASTVETGTSINFDAGASSDPDGTIVDFKFDYGDGMKVNGTASTASHSYSTPGRYTVILTVTDDDGNTSSISVPIRINAPPAQPRDLLADIWWLIIIIVVLTIVVVFLAYERRKWKAKAGEAETETVESGENPK